MRKKRIILFIILTIIISSCNIENNPTPTATEQIAEGEKITSTTSPVITVLPETTLPIITTTPATISLFPIIAINEEKSFLRIRHPLSEFWVGNELSLSFYYYAHLVVTDEFINLVNQSEYENWNNFFIKTYEDFNEDIEKLYVDRIDLNEFNNLYTFINCFNLSEQQIKDSLLEWNEFGAGRDLVDHIYSDEEINALTTRNKEEITRLFATPLAIVKGDKIYVPGWFFYSSIEDYKNADITSDDLITVLNNCRNFQYYGSEIPFGENSFSHRYLLDLIEYKAYNYLDCNVDVTELCGYERDFSMPMAFNGYYESILRSDYGSERYHAFFNTSYEYDTSFYNIIKNETTFSPHWVYYNKPAAYLEAGITPEELIEMLPKYEALGILTDEAWAALQGKIYAYAEIYNETSE